MVVETYRLDRYDNRIADGPVVPPVVEAYRLDGYDNPHFSFAQSVSVVVEAYRLDRYDNLKSKTPQTSSKEL